MRSEPLPNDVMAYNTSINEYHEGLQWKISPKTQFNDTCGFEAEEDCKKAFDIYVQEENSNIRSV
jgi:hypothetical protein